MSEHDPKNKDPKRASAAAADVAKEYTLRELAEEADVPERTIRFYISRGLVDPPLRGGRGAAYGEKHKEQLESIRKLQAKGMMLSQIAHALAAERVQSPDVLHPLVAAETRPGEMVWFKADGTIDESSAAALAVESAEAPARPALSPVAPVQALSEPTVWRSYAVASDATVMLKAGGSPWRTRALLDALRRFAAEIGEPMKKENKGE